MQIGEEEVTPSQWEHIYSCWQEERILDKQKQATVALFSTEAEYMAVMQAAKHAL